MVSLSATPWSGYTQWTTAATGMLAARTVWGEIFGNLVWALNGGLGAENFQSLVNLYYTPGRTWAKVAVKESKVTFDPQDGHAHDGHARDAHKICKKNLDPRSARVVWTALDGSTFVVGSSGLVVLGGMAEFSVTAPKFASGNTPGDHTTAGWVAAPPSFVFWGQAWYGHTGGGLATWWPWASSVQPVVHANFLVRSVLSGTVALPPAIYSWGRWGIEQVPLGHAAWTAGSTPGFWVWWNGFSMQHPQTATTHYVHVRVPWLAFGPGRDKVISWA